MSRLRVLYEDNHLLVVVKPPGVPTQADASGDPSLLDLGKEYIKKRYNKPGEVYLGMVHRLDRPTGGVVAFGRTSKAAARLSDQFRQRRVKKTYLAVCQGVPQARRAKLVHYLKKLPGVNRMVALDKEKNGSQRCELSYQVLGESADRKQALLEVSPLTGRQHQIRVQLARIDHPLAFDVKYSNREHDRGIVPAIGLWAYRLQLTHPTSGKLMTFTARPDPTPGSAWHPFANLLRAGEDAIEENPLPEDKRSPKGKESS
jgi:23S rRNA pseudouridine1911/1915/1917 synthase